MPVPATVLTIDADVNANNTQLTITDTTPDGGTGYNQASGLAIANVTSATLDVTLTKTDTTTTIFPTIHLIPTVYNPSPFVLDEKFILEMDSFGGNAGDKFFEGVADIKYTVNGTVSSAPVSYTVTKTQLFKQSSKCCIDGMISGKIPCGCGDNQDDLFNAKMNLEAAQAAADCDKPYRALELLGETQRFCAGKCSDC